MDKDRQIAKDKFKEYTLFEKIKYYWDYYKYRYMFAFLIFILIGFTVYTKVTEVKYDLEIGLYSNDTYDEDMQVNIEKTMTKWLNEKFADKEEHPVGINSVYLGKQNKYSEAAVAANTKLTAELASGKNTGFILDEQIYNDYFVNGVYGTVQDKEHSCEIGSNAKKVLGLNQDTTLYYVTIYSASAKSGNEKEIAKYNNAIFICEKIRQLK